MAKLPKLGKSFTMKFYIYPTTSPTPEVWHSVLSMKVVDSNSMSQGIAGLWFQNHSTNGFLYNASFVVNGKHEYRVSITTEIKLNKWNVVRIGQYNDSGKYFFVFVINKVLMWKTENTTPMDYNNVTLWLTDNDTAQTGYVKNMTIYGKTIHAFSQYGFLNK